MACIYLNLTVTIDKIFYTGTRIYSGVVEETVSPEENIWSQENEITRKGRKLHNYQAPDFDDISSFLLVRPR
jgi:hypothetical protein